MNRPISSILINNVDFQSTPQVLTSKFSVQVLHQIESPESSHQNRVTRIESPATQSLALHICVSSTMVSKTRKKENRTSSRALFLSLSSRKVLWSTSDRNHLQMQLDEILDVLRLIILPLPIRSSQIISPLVILSILLSRS